jgi:hypothetical protein
MFHMILFSVNCLMYVILLYVVLLVIVLNMAFILLFVFFWIYSIYFWVLYSPPLFLSLSCLILSGSPCFCMCVSSFLCVNCRCYYFSLFHYRMRSCYIYCTWGCSLGLNDCLILRERSNSCLSRCFPNATAPLVTTIIS